MPNATMAAVQSQIMTAPTPNAARPMMALVAGSANMNVPENCRSPGPNAIQLPIAPTDKDRKRDQILRRTHPPRRPRGQFAARIGVTERLDGNRDAGEKKCQARAKYQPQRTVEI